MIRIDITNVSTNPKIKEKCKTTPYEELGNQGILSFPHGTTIEDILLNLGIVVTNSHARRLVHQGAITIIKKGEAPVKPTSPVEPLEAGRIELKIAKKKLLQLRIGTSDA